MKTSLRVFFAALIALGTSILQLALWDAIDPFAWMLYYPAVIVAALLLGAEGGVVTSLLSALFIYFALASPRFGFALEGPRYVFILSGVAATGIVISLLVGRLRQLSGRQAAQDGELRFRYAIERAPIPIMIHAEDGSVLSLNRAWTELTGYTLQDVPTTADWTEKAYGEQKEVIRGYIAGIYGREHSKAERESCIRCRDGSERIWNFSSVGLGALPGGPRIAISMAMDITERKQAETLVQQSEESLSITLHSIGDAVIATDSDGRIKRMNPTAERLTGWRQEEALDQRLPDIFRIVDADTREPVGDPVLRVMAERRVVGLADRTVLLARDGREFRIADSAAPIRNAAGEIVGVVLVFNDVTDKYQLEKGLLEEQQFSKSIIEHLPGIFYLYTYPENRLVLWNKKHEILLGYSPEEMLGRHVTDWHLPEARGAVLQVIEALMDRGESEIEATLLAKDGHRVDFSLSGTRFEAGKRLYFLGIGLDITARKAAENELENYRQHLEEMVAERTCELDRANASLILARDAAEAANRAKSAFLANMSHEIRTPLNGIIGMTHILQRSSITPQQADRLNKIDTAAEHLLSTINDILDLSKIEAGKVTLEETQVDINSLLENVNSIVGPRAQSKGLRLQIATENGHRHLLGDPTRLQQALLNYATNAIKFSAAGTVTLRTILQEENAESVLIRFEVQDTGIGIARETLSRLFAAFEQADNSTTRQYGGTGLGLAITRRLAKLMGGEAGAESTLGAGSTFWFTARLKKSAGPDARESLAISAADQALRQGHAGRRILVVDDDPINLEVARYLLEDVGLLVDTAADGVYAIAKAGESPYAVVLMDMQMPGMDGIKATAEIRQLPGHRHTPILAMTANAFAEDRARCLDAGMDDFIAKPFNPDFLYSVLLKWLDQTPDVPDDRGSRSEA